MNLKHALIRNPLLNGFEYGVLHAFEEEVLLQTNASVVTLPENGAFISKAVGHGTRWDFARKAIPKKQLDFEADVLWAILMGPENYELDLFNGWESKAKYRILYLFDTLEAQYPLIRKLFSNADFNILITSFNDAVPALEKLTGKKWHVVEQGVPHKLFTAAPLHERIIDFSSYGRRIPAFHEALKEYCVTNNLYYDYSTHQGGKITVARDELYNQYAWHLSHAKFTVSWPVELTHSKRAGRLNPITCRWFEAAMAGTVIIGQVPNNPFFNSLFEKDTVIHVDPTSSKKEIWKFLDNIYLQHSMLLDRARENRAHNYLRWSLQDRVERMLKLIDAKNV